MIIDDLPSISIANDSDEIAIEQGTATKKITKGNFLQEVTSAISSLLSSLSGKVSKAGDTMTGDLKIQKSRPTIRKDATNFDNQIGQGVPSTETIYAEDTIYDRDESLTGYSQIFKDQNDLLSRSFLLRRRNASGTAIFNGFILRIDSSGNPVVSFPSTSVSAAWRSALGLCYAANDTYQTTASIILPGAADSSSKNVYFTMPIPKSMENISTVTVTSFSGWIAGPLGPLNGSSANVQFVNASGYTLSCIKLNDYSIRITLTKSTAFTNSVNNGCMNFLGQVSLRFT